MKAKKIVALVAAAAMVLSMAAQITAVPMQKTEAQQQRQQKHLTVIHWLWQPTQHSRHMNM